MNNTPKARKGLDGARLTPAKEPMTPSREMPPPETPASLRKIKKQLFFSPGTPMTPGMQSPSQTPVRRIRRVIADPNREPMKVFLRVRPLKREEAEKGAQNCIDIESEQSVILRAPKDSLAFRANGGDTEARYTFTGVFDSTTQQMPLFRATAMPLVASFLQGSNGLAFAYGVTNAGKTYTIMGTKGQAGLLPRILDVIFNSINPTGTLLPKTMGPGRKRKSLHLEESEWEYSSSEYDVSSISSQSDVEEDIPRVEEKTSLPVDPNCRYAVWISYTEIYNEKIFDLLEDNVHEDGRKDLKEDKAGHVFVKGLKEVLISSAEEGHAAIRKGFNNRQKAATLLNQDSSRSHNVITLKLVQIPKDKDPAAIKKDPSLIKYSKLSIIDLAGSERNSRSKTSGARLKEAANINASLMTLGRCMEALRWNQQHTNNQKLVPFRDSKLTRLFQDYFIGNGKAIMIANASPSSFDYDETCHALKFSAIAKEISTSTRVDSGKSKSNTELDENTDALLESQSLRSQEKEEELKEWEELLRMEREQLDTERAEMEAAIRDEVSGELAARLEEVEREYKRQLQQQSSITEDKYERKILMFNSMNSQMEEAESVSRTTFDELQKELERLKEKDEEHQEQSRKFVKQIANLEKEREKLLRQIAELEETLSVSRSDQIKEVNYWKDKASHQDDEKQKLCNDLKAQLDASLREQANLSSKVEELSKKLKNKGSSSPFSSLGKDRGAKVLHSQIEPASSDCPLPKNSKNVKTPTKKDLKKFKNYEVMDLQSPTPDQSVAALYKGHVDKSVTGDGVSVVFDDVEVHPRGLNSSHGSLFDSPAPSRRSSGSRADSPTITLTPPNGATNVIFDPLQDPLQEDAIMQEEEMEDDEWEDLPLDELRSKSQKEREKKEKKEKEKQQKQLEKEQKEKQKQLEKEQKKKQPKIASSPIHKVFGWKKGKETKASPVPSPQTAQEVIDRIEEKELEETRQEKDKENSTTTASSKRKLFNNNAPMIEEEDRGAKKGKTSTKKGKPTPIARRLRSAQQTRRASITRQI